MKEKILYFESVGMEQEENNNLSCRVRTAFRVGGLQYYLELTDGTATHIRHTNLRTGAQLKHPVYTRLEHRLFIDYCYCIGLDQNQREHNLNIETDPLKRPLYTLENILQLVNNYFHTNFTKVVFLPRFSGYYVHKSGGGHNLMDDFIYNPIATAKRNKVYKELAFDYYLPIYKRNQEINHFYTYGNHSFKYCSWSVVNFNDEQITLRSHTYQELINENEREHTFLLKDVEL